MKKQPYRFYAGAYTGGGAPGIMLFQVDAAAGRLIPAGAFAGSENPSYLAAFGDRLYAVNELADNGRVAAYAVDAATGALSPLGTLDVPGRGLCHIAVWPDGSRICVAGYLSGSFASCPIGDGGLPGKADWFFQSGGSGPDAKRQDGPHAHSMTPSPDGRYWFGADLGSDRLHIFAAGPDGLSPNPAQPWVSAEPGGGPRHLAFRPDGRFACLVMELSSRVAVFAYDAGAGTLAKRQELSTLPPGWADPSQAHPASNLAAAVRYSPDGRFLYVTNRGADQIASFPVRPDGTLRAPAFYPAGGHRPRDFSLSPDGRFAVSANQGSGDLILYERDAATGALRQMDKTPLPRAVCVLWSEMQESVHTES